MLNFANGLYGGSEKLDRSVSSAANGVSNILPFEKTSTGVQTSDSLWQHDMKQLIIALYKRLGEITEQWIKEDMIAQAAMLRQYERKMELKRRENSKKAHEAMIVEDSKNRALLLSAMQRLLLSLTVFMDDAVQQTNAVMMKTKATRLFMEAAQPAA